MGDEIYAYSHKTADGLVKTGPGVLHAIVLSAGSANATVDVYDETSGSGDVMAVVTAVANSSESAVLDVAFGVGCYVDLTGTGAKVTVAYN
jgi:hypothetical protein